MWYLRLAFLSIIRCVMIFALIIFSQRFEVSPLPAWTLTAFVFLMEGVATYLVAMWAFARVDALSSKNTALVGAVFIGTEFLVQTAFMMWYGERTLAEVLAGMHWGVFLLIAWYSVAIWAAAYRMRRRAVVGSLPEGMES